MLPVGKEKGKCQRGPGVASLRAKRHKNSEGHTTKKRHTAKPPRELFLEASGRPAGGGRLRTTAMQHLGRGCVGPKLLPEMAPAWDQQTPRAAVTAKHGNEIGTAYLPLKLLRSVQSEREKQM